MYSSIPHKEDLNTFLWSKLSRSTRFSSVNNILVEYLFGSLIFNPKLAIEIMLLITEYSLH